MKILNLVLAIAMATIVLTSCEKNDPETLNNQVAFPAELDEIGKTLVQEGYESNGAKGDLYITDSGQRIVLVKEVVSKRSGVGGGGSAFYDRKLKNIGFGKVKCSVDCVDGKCSCTKGLDENGEEETFIKSLILAL